HGDEKSVRSPRGEAGKRERSGCVPEAGARARESGGQDADLVCAAAWAVHVRDLRRLPRRAGPREPPERPDRQGADGAGTDPAGLAAVNREGRRARREACSMMTRNKLGTENTAFSVPAVMGAFCTPPRNQPICG